MFLSLLTVVVVGHLQGFSCTVTTSKDLSVLEGQSVTVPCHYNPQYTNHVKYWCQGLMREFCTSLARTDDRESAPSGNGRVTIADDPTQQVFTVTMRDLMEGDSGWYWCGVEVGGMWTSDSTAFLYISVVQGVSAEHSMVSADEGDNISVQCTYSQNLRSSEKKWCRSGDPRSCVVTDSDGTFSSEHVLVSDDRNSVFKVMLPQVEVKDSGWYWCAAGQKQVAVHVSVNPRAETASSVQIEKSTAAHQPIIKSNNFNGQHVLESSWVVCGGMLLVITASLVILKVRQQCIKKNKPQEKSEMSNKLMMSAWRESDHKNTSVIFLSTPAQ